MDPLPAYGTHLDIPEFLSVSGMVSFLIGPYVPIFYSGKIARSDLADSYTFLCGSRCLPHAEPFPVSPRLLTVTNMVLTRGRFTLLSGIPVSSSQNSNLFSLLSYLYLLCFVEYLPVSPLFNNCAYVTRVELKLTLDL